MSSPKYECSGCGSMIEGDRLIWPVPEVCEKVLPGEEMPAGECPECSELVYVDDERRSDAITEAHRKELLEYD